MEKHQFKIIYSNEDDVYRILDLTDTSIVGITEMLETEYDRDLQIIQHNELKTKKTLGAKVKGYGIFIYLDEDNSPKILKPDDDYLRPILRQMAAFFKSSEIDKNPDFFKEYYIPQGNRNTTLSDTNKTPEKSPSVENLTTKAPVEERVYPKKRIEASDIIVYVIYGLIGLVVLAAIVGVIWLIFHVLSYGIIGGIIFILCGLAFIPELFRGK